MSRATSKIRTKLEWQPITGSRVLKGGHRFEGLEGGAFAMRELRDSVVPSGMAAGAAQLAGDMEAFARANAPWTDRSGDARRELSAAAEADGGTVRASIAHGVDYGIWLENRFNGRYAIISRTMEVFAGVARRIMAGGVKAALEGRGSKVRDVKSGRFSA